jgi:hypothetical protein
MSADRVLLCLAALIVAVGVGVSIGTEFGDEIRRGCNRLLRRVPPPVQVAAPRVVRSPLVDVPAGWATDERGVLQPPVPRHASSERINCGGRMTAQAVPRKRTADRQPWDTDRFAVIRPEPYIPEMTP